MNTVYKLICWAWLAVLVVGLNATLALISPGLLVTTIFLFCLADLGLNKFSFLAKGLVAMLIIHRTFYVGSFLSRQWLGWLGADLSKDIFALLEQGWSPSPVLGMVVTFVALGVLQFLCFSFIAQGKGALMLIFIGTSLLTGASLWYEQGTPWYAVLYLVIGLVIMGTSRIQAKAFPMQRWLSITMILVLCITSIAWVIPGGDLDLGKWSEKVQVAWERLLDQGDDLAPRRVGYSSYTGELGGPLENDYTHVMTVTSPRPVYLAGQTQIDYGGRGWLRQYETPRAIQPPPEGVEGEIIEVSIEMALSHGRTLFAPRYALDFHFSNNSLIAMDSIDYNFLSESTLQAGDVYTVNVLLPADDPDLLRQAASQDQDSRYLNLAGVPMRVINLAREITAPADNGYDKAIELAGYLKGGKYSYSLEVDHIPPGSDFVDWFLFEQDRGYCVHFSTAFVILARASGLPARGVTGFSSGVSDGQGKYNISNSHAHAWAEVWFDDYGWVPFEATPGRSLLGPAPAPRPNPSLPEIPAGPEGTLPDPGPDHSPQAPAQSSSSLGYLIAILIAALAVGILVLAQGISRKGESPAALYSNLQTRLRLFGWHRQVWETPREHLDRVNCLPDKPAMTEFIQKFEASVYGGGGPFPGLRVLAKRFSILRLVLQRFTLRS